MASALKGVVVLTVGLAVFLPAPVLAANSAIVTATNYWNSIPTDVPVDIPLPQHSVLLDKNGKKFADFYAENRTPVTSAEIPDNIRSAIVATEDARFYQNHGFDIKGTLRAFLSSARGGDVQGGSGITQQYVKNLLVANAKNSEEVSKATSQTITRKIAELKGAVELEKRKTKDEILVGYLNTIYFGDQAYGIDAASKHYFSKTPTELTLPEAALLAGVINSPTAYNPENHPEAAKQRRNHVLSRMLSENYITQQQYDEAIATPIALNVSLSNNGCIASSFPFYCSWVKQTLATDPVFGATQEERDQNLYRGGMTITTALDPVMQRKADRIASKSLDPQGGPATAFAVVQPGTGMVPVLASNKTFGKKKGQTEIVLATSPSFQNGSTFKPFTAATAIEAGMNPTVRWTAGETYTPKNRNSPKGGFHNDADGLGGNYNMAGALRHSVNTWFVGLEDKIGVRKTAETAYKMGLTSLPISGANAITERDASLTLGTYEVSPLEVANGYATIAAHGVHCNPVGIVKITRPNGLTVPSPPADCQQVIRASTADTVAKMLGGVIDGSDPGRTGKNASLGRPAAGKTGTTDKSSAVWFAGFTPQYASAVWIGDPRGGFEHPLESLNARGTTFSPVFGGGAPALIWRDVMKQLVAGKPKLPLPKMGGESFVGIPYVVPDVRGLTPEVAKAVLSQSDIDMKIDSKTGPKVNGLPSGVVSTQDAQGGDTLYRGVNKPVVTVKLTP